MKLRARRVGFTLIELVVVLAIVSVLAALLTMLLSAVVKAQRQSLLHLRQQTEFARLDAILRSDVHNATAAEAVDERLCSLTNQQGLQLIYRFRNGELQRLRHRSDDWRIVDRFFLRPGMRVNFRVSQENGRSLVQLSLDLPIDTTGAGSRETPYRGLMLVGGGSPAEQRAPAEVQP